jgi:hypothetical protein
MYAPCCLRGATSIHGPWIELACGRHHPDWQLSRQLTQVDLPLVGVGHTIPDPNLPRQPLLVRRIRHLNHQYRPFFEILCLKGRFGEWLVKDACRHDGVPAAE